jgi:hypothetical protein
MGVQTKRQCLWVLTLGIGLCVLGGARTPDPELRPDLNGSRLRAPGQATVYLIDKGFRRAVPNVPTYEALFRDWDCIVDDIDPETIRLGDPLGEAAALIRMAGHPGVYFFDGTTRRHVASPQVMDKYRFAWERVRDVNTDEMMKWPEGPKLR